MQPRTLIELAELDTRRGLRINRPGARPGYILFSPMLSALTYLVDRAGRVVHTWQSDYAPGSEYLLDDGHLMRSARVPNAPRFNGGGQSGRIEKLTFSGDLVWAYELADEAYLLHHDYSVMPNGNVLAIAWEARTPDEAAAAGRDPEQIPAAGLWPDLIVEIEPSEDGGAIVWEWRAWDHLVQNRDPGLPNYGEPKDHPGRIDINAGPPTPQVSAEQLAWLQATNQAPANASLADRGADLYHSNAIDYHADLDQIVLSVRALSELWVIDHGISAAAAQGPAGDLLYRWGNPAVYGHAGNGRRGLGNQHDVRWIPAGCPGAGNLTMFSNEPDHGRAPSEVLEVALPRGADGRYTKEVGAPFGPDDVVWSFVDGCVSPFISGAQRLADGNTLVMFGPQGRIVEVDPGGDVVWEYWSPFSGEVRMPDGSHPQPGAPFMYAAFRATFIPADHPALCGRLLSPLDPQPPPSVLYEAELAPFRSAPPR